jgi:hypothetical protein
MTNLSGPPVSINAAEAVGFFDKIAFRARRPLSKVKMKTLLANARSVDVRRGHPIRNSPDSLIVTIVAPRRKALELLAKCSESYTGGGSRTYNHDPYGSSFQSPYGSHRGRY